MLQRTISLPTTVKSNDPSFTLKPSPSLPDTATSSPIPPKPITSVLASLRASSGMSASLSSPRCGSPAWSRLALLDFLLEVLSQPLPRPADIDCEPSFRPQTPVAVPECFPVNPLPLLSNDSWHGLPLDIAFFAFAKKQNSFQQYIAARSLKKNNWKYATNERKWYFQSSTVRVSIGKLD